MLNDVLVEHVGGEVMFRRVALELVAREEPEQVALAAAVEAVSLDDRGVEDGVDLEGDVSAVAAAFEHRYPLIKETPTWPPPFRGR